MAHAPFTTPFRFNSAKRRQLTTPSHHTKVRTQNIRTIYLDTRLRSPKGRLLTSSLSACPWSRLANASNRQPQDAMRSRRLHRSPSTAITCTRCHRRSPYLSCASAISSLISLSPPLASPQCMSNIFALRHSMYRNAITPLQLTLVELLSRLHEFEVALQRGSA